MEDEPRAGQTVRRRTGAGVVPLPPPRAHPAVVPRLPAELTSFVGRPAALVAVGALLREQRLLTLTGPPGVGKTRLALRVAAREQRHWADGVALVELAPLSDARHVPKALARVLGVPEQAGVPLETSLTVALQVRSLLLLLDNCEHLVAGVAALVAHLLRECPHLHVLATSREPLEVAGEAVWPVPTLTLPEGETPTVVTASEAGELFVVRARAARPAFALTEANAAAVARICWQLDGIPLALELAAARLRALSADEVATRLAARFRLLTSGGRTSEARHRTLQAAVDWSYALLSPAEQVLLRRVAVFAGGWTLAAAEGVCIDDALPAETILDVLTGLVARSLVVATEERDGSTRYRLLETLREYGRARLAEAGEAAALRARHYAWYAAWAEAGEPHTWCGPEEVSWLWAIETEWANLRDALAWSLTDAAPAEATVRLTAALWHVWEVNGHLQEGRQWLEAALARAPTPSIARARSLIIASHLQTSQGEALAARALAAKARDLAQQCEDQTAYGFALLGLALASVITGEMAEGEALYGRVLALSRAAGLPVLTALALQHLGAIALYMKGDPAAAASYLEEAVALERAADARWFASIALAGLGLARALQGEAATATRLLLEALDLCQAMPFSLGEFVIPLGLGVVAAGRPERAARLCGIAEAITASQGLRGVAGFEQMFQQVAAGARVALGEAAFEAARGAGRALPRDAALAYMRAAPLAEASAAVGATGERGGLTRREREVAALVARGLSNREIAAALVIGERTVETHVTRVLQKLGFERRAQIITWASSAPPPDAAGPEV